MPDDLGNGPPTGEPVTTPDGRAASTTRRWWAVAGAAVVVAALVVGIVALNRGDDGSDSAPDTTTTTPDDVSLPSDPASATTEPVPTTSAASPPTDPPDTTSAPARPGPWSRECVEVAGSEQDFGDDEFADVPFGPLAPEPALRILYPEGTSRDGSFTPPVSDVARVPNGTFVRVNSGEVGDGLVVAVVDDDGSVRWRRCVEGLYGVASVVDAAAGLAHVQLFPADGDVGAWWTFDLASGERTEDTDAPAGSVPDEEPQELRFTYEDQRAVLQRVASDGTEVWRRADLFDPGDEGFRIHVSSPESGHPMLVRACTTDPAASAEVGAGCEQALLGLDPADGRTIWQLDGNYGVSLVADGYAIATDPDGPPSTYQLIDLDTGSRVPGGVSAAPGAFLSECCGGGDYNRVERGGAVAMSVATDWLDVWFPADRPGLGTTVDLLGTIATPQLTARRSWIAADGGCGDEWCTLHRVIGRGFTPGRDVDVRCWRSDGGEWTQVGESTTVTISADGTAAVDTCLAPMSLTGEHAYRVSFDDVSSNAVDG